MTTLAVLFTAVSLQQGLPPGLLSAICYTESRHTANVVHFNDGKSHSYGICQIKLEAARQVGFRGTAKELMIPAINIHYAGLYLKHQLRRYNSIKKAVIAYNRGHAGDLEESGYQKRVYKEWL